MIEIIIAILLIVSAINLTLMVPGGFVEVRDFSAYPAVVLGLFNTFLTLLGLSSFIFAYLIFKHNSNFWIPAFLGICYGIVYIIDLAKIFPKSPKTMSTLLKRLEQLGTIFAILLTAMSLWQAFTKAHQYSNSNIAWSVLILLFIVAISIITFATRAAIHNK